MTDTPQTTWSEAMFFRDVGRAAWAMAGALAAVAGSACGSEPGAATSSASAGGGVGGQSATTTTVTDVATTSSLLASATSTGAGPDAAAPCPDGSTEALPADVPPCWRRLPSMPEDCNVFFAPSAETMRPPSPWAPCGEGCLELVNDWSADPRVRLFAARGGAANGVRYISYKRALRHLETEEMQVIRLPENRVEFNGMIPNASGSRCSATGINVVGPSGHLLDVTQVGPSANILSLTAFFIPVGQPAPVPSYAGPEEGGFLFGTISSSLWAVVHQGAARMTWHGIDFAPELKPLYQKPGTVLFHPVSHGSDVFFSTWGGGSEIMAWDPAGGARKLVAFPVPKEGGACCLATDGKTMAWLQGTNYLGNQVYEKLHLVTAPYATQASALQPKVLRPAFQNSLIDGAVVLGGNYAAGVEILAGTLNTRLIVTRLSDGAYWVVPSRETLQSAQVLYIDDEELAIVEVPAQGQGGMVQAGYVWTIVRRTIASLGEPKKPGDGF